MKKQNLIKKMIIALVVFIISIQSVNANENKIEMGVVERVMDKYHLDPEKPNPINV